MKVFMLGWEFPPHISGGLGTACYGLTKGLSENGVEVCFVLPTTVPVDSGNHVQLRSPSDLAGGAPARRRGRERSTGTAEPHAEVVEPFEHIELHKVEAFLQPYGNVETYDQAIREYIARRQFLRTEGKAEEDEPDAPAAEGPETEIPEAPAPPAAPSGSFNVGGGANYEGDLFGQIHRYARLAVEIALGEEFDVVHAHDWMTYPAGLAVAAATGKPLVIHVHSTEFDRAGEHINQQVYDVERAGMHGAAKVICVSALTGRLVEHRYGVPPENIHIVYNAVEMPANAANNFTAPIRREEKIVLFLGRVTMQKGPEYFLHAARKVIEKDKNVRFVTAGSGDMIRRMIQLAADLKIGSHVTFTGFLRGQDVDRVFRMAELYVMPSVSEPFGIAPLEALSHNVPVLISKQSGVSEVLTHALKVDFWDTDEMANKILAVLRHKPLQTTLSQHGQIELRKFSWSDSAAKVKEVYQSVTR